MKTILLSFVLFTLSTVGFCTVHVITRSGYTFVPSTLTITIGDSVQFQLSVYHSVVEVSQTTWNANEATPLPGFSLPLGGGYLYPPQLTFGTHYYVCGEHASSNSMKGIIIVQYPEGIEENSLNSNISIYPNPSIGKFQLNINNLQFVKSCYLEIYNVKGENVYIASNINIQTSNEFDFSRFPKGIYFIRLYEGDLIYNRKIVIQ